MADDKYGAGRTFDAMNARGLAGKRDYVRSLEQRRDEEAMSLLVECLCDESWYLRELAEHALLRLGDRAGETLLPLLEQGLWFSRVSSARVLGRLGYGPAAAGLLRLLEDSVSTVAQAAGSSLCSSRRAMRSAPSWTLSENFCPCLAEVAWPCAKRTAGKSRAPSSGRSRSAETSSGAHASPT